ncbi:uncharacterized protein DS421_15g505640 [Arachis hypogaea]|nr:uncharacterized protein DS421_15g505640 [Arachis hypogaea]
MSRLELLLLLRVVGAEVASVVGERSAADSLELLAATGAVAGSVRNRSCFVSLVHAAMVIANVTGS